MDPKTKVRGRRELLRRGGILLGASALAALAGPAQAAWFEKEEEIGPTEDLMREHGALSRILLIYEAIAVRIETDREYPPAVLIASAGLIQHFVEDYHERLEEQHIFPLFRKAGRLTDLVQVLLAQHAAGRRLTAQILRQAGAPASSEPRRPLAASLRQFIRMYRPHKAREDTVLFPQLRGVASRRAYGKMGDRFEDRENELFGKNGFEKIVEQIDALERQMGIERLSDFTPPTA